MFRDDRPHLPQMIQALKRCFYRHQCRQYWKERYAYIPIPRILVDLPQTDELKGLRGSLLHYSITGIMDLPKLKCVYAIRREFYQDGEHDGGETEFIYENDLRTISLLEGCKTLDEAKMALGEPEKVGYHWILTEVKIAGGKLP